MARERNKKTTGLVSLGSFTRKTRWLIPVNNDKTYLKTEFIVINNICFKFFLKDANNEEPEISGERELKILTLKEYRELWDICST